MLRVCRIDVFRCLLARQAVRSYVSVAGSFKGTIPEDKLNIAFSRSSGPGGQNVNKVNTKTTLRLHVASASWIEQEIKENLLVQERSRLNKSGELVLSSQEHRTQRDNLNNVIAKLRDALDRAAYVPEGPSEAKQQRVQKLIRVERDRRKNAKMFQSNKKRERSQRD